MRGEVCLGTSKRRVSASGRRLPRASMAFGGGDGDLPLPKPIRKRNPGLKTPRIWRMPDYIVLISFGLSRTHHSVPTAPNRYLSVDLFPEVRTMYGFRLYRSDLMAFCRQYQNSLNTVITCCQAN